MNEIIIHRNSNTFSLSNICHWWHYTRWLPKGQSYDRTHTCVHTRARTHTHTSLEPLTNILSNANQAVKNFAFSFLLISVPQCFRTILLILESVFSQHPHILKTKPVLSSQRVRTEDVKGKTCGISKNFQNHRHCFLMYKLKTFQESLKLARCVEACEVKWNLGLMNYYHGQNQTICSGLGISVQNSFIAPPPHSPSFLSFASSAFIVRTKGSLNKYIAWTDRAGKSQGPLSPVYFGGPSWPCKSFLLF